MEWQAQIPCGKAKLHVNFTGGTLTAYGVTPAKYSTSNPIIQGLIENSDYFKKGRITLLNKMERSTQQELSAKKPAKKAKPDKDTTVVKVASMDDAKDYLMEHFGIKAQALVSQKAIIDVGKENGVTFKVAE